MGRTNGQCSQRWLLTSANPDTGDKCRRWTSVEDAKLLEAMKKFGNDWTAVAVLVPDRTNIQCGKRWARAFDPANSDKGPWTPEEDATLTEAVTKLGTNDWHAIAALVPRRGNLQCRQRWLCHLLPAQSEWTSEEDINLIEAVGECGDDWTAVAALVPDRTDTECGKRWARAFGSSNGDKEL
jgi:myb proto-oncogene protein